MGPVVGISVLLPPAQNKISGHHVGYHSQHPPRPFSLLLQVPMAFFMLTCCACTGRQWGGGRGGRWKEAPEKDTGEGNRAERGEQDRRER
eukprot:757623-Hanusia_phi.AAC.6